MNMLNKLLLLLLLPLSSAPFTADCKTAKPLKITIGNEATAIPFTRFVSTPIHPALQIGTEFLYREKSHHRLYQTANVGYIFHNNLYQGLYINTGLGYDYKTPWRINLKSILELGYLHTFATQEEYQFRDGSYTNSIDAGNARLMPSLSLGAGYRLKDAGATSPEVYLLYKSWIEYPYSPGFIPVMTHINLEVGCKLYLKKHEKK